MRPSWELIYVLSLPLSPERTCILASPSCNIDIHAHISAQNEDCGDIHRQMGTFVQNVCCSLALFFTKGSTDIFIINNRGQRRISTGHRNERELHHDAFHFNGAHMGELPKGSSPTYCGHMHTTAQPYTPTQNCTWKEPCLHACRC